tara:strand:+ start:397 stop:1329 length:933 start_codon:yes stop_codon:yes gene_type:complete
MKKLSKLEKVKLRDIWSHEATDFTQWLGKEENINELLDEISISAENIITEDGAGRYNVDITADETETGKKIIIENQLEVTDHKHLGQLLTYASSFDACIIVWVVADFREEHKQAIEWFNENMNEEISFFLVKTEVWRIDDSEPAVKFNVIVEPNNWSKIIKNSSSSKSPLTERKLMNLKFWQGLNEYADHNKTQLKIRRKPRPQHWYTVSIGSSLANLAFTTNSKHDCITAEIYIPKDTSLFESLENNKEDFMKIVDYDNVSWEPLPEKQASRIRCTHTCKIQDENKWGEYYDWYIEIGEKLEKAFRSHS